uniref:Uncharacterized protein n=1 Tax=Romanomermis culicivorax TaxID=13658 RepID=A0A915HIB3_ROMCU
MDKRGGARFITGSDKKAGARFLDDGDDGDVTNRRLNLLRRFRDYLKKRGGAEYILGGGGANGDAEDFRDKRGGARFVPDSWARDIVRKRPGARRYFFDRSPHYFLMDKRPGARYTFFNDNLY